jgi:flagellar hook protein FlgE
MLDTILIGTSGMLAHSAALKVVSNNLANVNTPGFKGAQLEFSSLFEQGGNPNQSEAAGTGKGEGQGLHTVGSTLDFRAGSDLTTGNPLNVKIDGNGFFAVKHDGQILYTRDGAFSLNPDGFLVNGAGDHVLGLDNSGQLSEVSIAGLMHSQAKVTSAIKFSGNISSTVATPAVNAKLNNVTVYDATGAAQTLNLSFANNGSGVFTVTVTDALGAAVGTGTLKFGAGGTPQAGFDSISLNVQPSGGTAFPVTLDFSSNVTSNSSANSIAFSSQDGYAGGVSSGESIGADGVLTIQYSNGQTQKGPQLALADFASAQDLQQAGNNLFRATQGAKVQWATAGQNGLGSLQSGHREGSNVDMAQEFSELILMQRGYQAASHIVSVANDMIQELFDMKGHR